MIKFTPFILLITLFTKSFWNVQETNLNGSVKENDIVFSSMNDPEERYSYGKALGDVGVFPDRQYKGEGIKIGIIDKGFPFDMNNYNIGGTLGVIGAYDAYGNLPTHGHMVTSLIGGPSGIASEATLYIASKVEGTGYSFERCLKWLVEEIGVDVINHSSSIDDFGGKYNSQSYYIDKYIAENNVIFVNSIGNSDSDFEDSLDTDEVIDRGISSIAMGINVVSVGANDIELQYSNVNIIGVEPEYDFIEKPNAVAPGKDLFGLHTQQLNALDTNLNGYTYNTKYKGTSVSAPIVTGIIALLLEEFPSLKNKPEAIQSILEISKTGETGIINYQLARQTALNYITYNILSATPINATIKNIQISIPTNSTIYFSNFILQNTKSITENGGLIEPSSIKYSKIKFKIINSLNQIVFQTTTENPLNSYSFTNTSNQTEFNILFSLAEKKSNNFLNDLLEKACFSYRIDSVLEHFSINYSSMNLDSLPVFDYEVDYTYDDGTVNIVFYNYVNQIILRRENLPCNALITLTLSEWHQLLTLRGREFYCYISANTPNDVTYYSEISILNEPKTFSILKNINPSQFNFPSAYNSEPITTTKVFFALTLEIERLRCGYIEQQYINLSAKKEGCGHAYLQIIFSQSVSYLSFGLTQWKDLELASWHGDTAIVETLNSDGVWEETIDLLEGGDGGSLLPLSRKDVVRFDVRNIKGIRFNVTSNPIGNTNGGRLCIDNISFTTSSTFSNYLCLFTEPIVERESFGI